MFEQGQSGSSDRSTEFELANNEHWEPSRDSSAPDSSCPAVKKYRSTPPRANPPRPDILLLLLEKERERERSFEIRRAGEEGGGEGFCFGRIARGRSLSIEISKKRERKERNLESWSGQGGILGGCKKSKEIVFLFSCSREKLEFLLRLLSLLLLGRFL